MVDKFTTDREKNRKRMRDEYPYRGISDPNYKKEFRSYKNNYKIGVDLYPVIALSQGIILIYTFFAYDSMSSV